MTSHTKRWGAARHARRNELTELQDAIKALIAERFEKALADKNSPPTVNGNGADHSAKADSHSPPPKKTHKRKSESEEDDDTADVAASPPPKKKPRKPTDVEDDAAFAARLQAEENNRARPTRTGATRKSAPSKRKSPKKKTASKVRVEDDSDLDSGADKERKVNRSGGFHVSGHCAQRDGKLTSIETIEFVGAPVSAAGRGNSGMVRCILWASG